MALGSHPLFTLAPISVVWDAVKGMIVESTTPVLSWLAEGTLETSDARALLRPFALVCSGRQGLSSLLVVFRRSWTSMIHGMQLAVARSHR